MAEKIVRIALDITVKAGDPKAVEEISNEMRKDIGNFITGSVIPDHEDGSGIESKVVGGATHQHNTNIGYCEWCDRWSRAELLPSVESN
jgi:hypothetical protein